MSNEQAGFPTLDKSDARLSSPEAHARALELACRAAAQIMASRTSAADDRQEPLPASSTALLRRLARGHG